MVWGELRAGRWEAASDRGAPARACTGRERATVQIGGWARAEGRTANTPIMFVTREVSQLSG